MKQDKKRSGRDRQWLWVLLAAGGLLAISGLICLFASGERFVPPKQVTVCLDPGHGGTDPGAVWEDRTEKEDNLRMALAVRQAILDYGLEDVTVILTREDDREVSLEQRTELANQADATLFVSIHRNSGGGRGVETWVSARGLRPESRLARLIQNALVQVGVSKDRGVKQGTASNPSASYFVVGHTQMPACLVELGFADSEEDNRLLEEHFDEYAQAIAQGILEMVDRV